MGKKSKKKLKSLYIFPVLFSIVCLSYALRYVFYNVDTELLKYSSKEDSIESSGIIIRNEWYLEMPESVYPDFKVDEGEKVSYGTKIAVVSNGKNIEDNIALKIKKLDERIKEIQNNDASNNFFASDKSKLQSSIEGKVAAIKSIANSGQLEKLAEIKEELEADLYKQSLISGQDSFTGKNLSELLKEREELQKIYDSNANSVILSKVSGLVCYDIDGYENILSPLNISKFRVSDIKELIKSFESNKNNENKKKHGVKVVDNFEWYICSIISQEAAKGLKQGKKIEVRFKELDNLLVSAKVQTVSKADNNEVLLILKINEHVKDFYKYRLVNLDIIKDYKEGFIVPSKCIIEKDGKKGVYVIKKGVTKFIPVEILSDDGSNALIDNIKEIDTSIDEGIYVLKPYDEVIVSVKRVKENQLVSGRN